LVQNGGSSTKDTFLRRHHKPLYRLSAKGWIDRKGGKRGPWVVRDLAAAKAVVESGDSARLMKTSALG